MLVIHLHSLWSFQLTTGQRLALFYAACGSVAGPSSRRPVQSSFFLPSLYGFQHTSDGLTETSEYVRDQMDYSILARSVTQSAGSSSHRAGATGRQRLQECNRSCSKGRISLVRYRFIILYGGGDATVYQTLASKFTEPSGLSFLLFNLLCAPCFAAMGAIKREMNSAKWFWFAIGYQCGLAYLVSLVVYQINLLLVQQFLSFELCKDSLWRS